MNKALYFLVFFTLNVSCISAQEQNEITRIEFNSGTRSYREQIILTPDSVLVIKEDFTVDLKPKVKARSNSPKEWKNLVQSLANIRLTEIETLESPTMKRAYDGASHGSLIITTKDAKTYTHGFDDMDPHERFRPLMEQIKKYRKK